METPENYNDKLDLKWLDDERPKNRSECKYEPRPCPWAMCKYHLYLEVDPKSGKIRLNFPHKEIWELEHSCALDIADQGPQTLSEVGKLFKFSRERVRQLEAMGLRVLKKNPGLLVNHNY